MLLSCDQTQVIYFISRFAQKVLKNNFLSGCEESPVLGQLMVLSQLDWPAEAKLLWQLLQSVQKKGNFVYPGLLSYITSIHHGLYDRCSIVFDRLIIVLDRFVQSL